jgi:hypothetical protein
VGLSQELDPRSLATVFFWWYRFISRGPLAAILPLFPRRLQLPIPLGLNFLLVLPQNDDSASNA